MEIRRLGPGDEDVLRALATRTPQTALLGDDRCLFLVAFEDGGEPVGFVLAYDLPRRHGDPTTLFVYEVGVDARLRRTGVGRALMRELAALSRARGTNNGFVLTNASNEAAMAFYAALGGTRPNDDDVLWDFEFAAG